MQRSRARDASGHTFELGVVDAEGPGGPVEAHEAQPELGQARDARPVRNGPPDVSRRLGADPVNAKGRSQADDAARNAPAGHREGVTLRRLDVRQTVQAAADPLDLTRADEGGELVGRQTCRFHLTGSEEGTESGPAKLLDGPGRGGGATRIVGTTTLHACTMRQEVTRVITERRRESHCADIRFPAA